MVLRIEQNAFEEAMGPVLLAKFGCGWKVHDFEPYSYHLEGVQLVWEGWLAAKEHAKTPVSVFQMFPGPVWTHDASEYSFGSKEEAVKDAVDKGYRVTA